MDGTAAAGAQTPAEMSAFGVVANVRSETAQGEGGLDIRRGLRHFSGGAKVWVLPPQWGDGGEKLFVVGRHRGNRTSYIRIVIESRHLENFRVRGIYSPALLRAMTRPGRGERDYPGHPLWRDREAAERFAAARNVEKMQAVSPEGITLAWVPNPPPLDLDAKGRIWHLAHLNNRRALYSPLEPPEEPVL
ncbi:hypothetical protein [Streptodolium elevatio]|uniref:Uncharacterized protein n=1 Tax=Streptodolium elevatio TaxID=3157996 RepID=A0ABV3DKZ6_9ACTN